MRQTGFRTLQEKVNWRPCRVDGVRLWLSLSGHQWLVWGWNHSTCFKKPFLVGQISYKLSASLWDTSLIMSILSLELLLWERCIGVNRQVFIIPTSLFANLWCQQGFKRRRDLPFHINTLTLLSWLPNVVPWPLSGLTCQLVLTIRILCGPWTGRRPQCATNVHTILFFFPRAEKWSDEILLSVKSENRRSCCQKLHWPYFYQCF